VIFSHFFAPSVGGVETAVASLALGLAELQDGLARFDVSVVTNTPAKGYDDSTHPFRVFRFPSFLTLCKLVYAADIIHVAGPALAPLLAGWVMGKPRVIEHHGYQAICPNGLLLEFPQASLCPGHFQAKAYGKCLKCQSVEMPRVKAMLKLLLMFARRFLVKSATAHIAITDHVLRRHALPSSERIYYGIPEASTDETLTNPTESLDRFCFAYLGRFVAEKGITVLLQAAEILKRQGFKFRVDLIGDGPERTRIESVISEKGLTDYVHITGYLTGASLRETLKDCRAIVMPSVWEETAGLSAIEQMMRGRLVIASDIGGLGEVVGDAGLLCVPGDAVSLSSQMKVALSDGGLVTSFGARARIRAQRLFGRERMIKDHANLYRMLLGADSEGRTLAR
jgi:glycosyltransferase involved in cell wall biosynthesis